MITYNDVLCAKFADRVSRITSELPITAPLAQLDIWLASDVEGAAVPTSAEVIAAKSVFEADIAAGAAALAAKQAEQNALDTERITLKADAAIQTFVGMTPAQVIADVAAITNLADAKTAIRRLSLMLLVLAKREFK